MKKDILEKIVLDTYDAHKSKFETLKKRWLELVARYENRLRAGSITANTESKTCLGGAFSLVENAIPRLFSRQPKYRYLARGREDSEAAEMYDEFSEYQWSEASCQSKIKNVGRWGLVTGLVGWRMGWKEETKIYKKRTKTILGIEVTNKLLEPLATTQVKEEEETVSNYTFDPIKPFDLLWSTEAEEVEDCRVIGYKTQIPLRELKSQGYDVKDLYYDARESDYWKKQLEQLDGINNYRANRLVEDSDIEVSVMYVRVLNDQGYYEYHVVTLGCYGENNPRVIRNEENTLDRKFAPMGIFRPIDRLGKFYGFGLVEPSKGVLDSEEDTLNIAMEALWTDVARPMEYNPSNVLAPDGIKYGSRVLIPVKNLGQSVAVLNTPTPNMNGVNLMTEYLQKAKQNISGITDYQTGSEQLAGQKTLGEIQIKTQESNARISMIMDNFEKQVLEPMGKMALWMNQQFLAENPKIMYRVIGKKGRMIEKAIKFKDVEAIKDVIVVSGSTMLASQQSEIQKWSLVLNQANTEAQMPPGVGVPINREAIWERLFENGLQIKDVETFLPSVKEREQQNAQGKAEQIKDAKSENANPLTARVLPTDAPEVHIPLHQAEVKAREAEVSAMEQSGQVDQRKVEELQMLIQHLNDHTAQAGGAVPPHSAGMMVGQGMPNAQANPGASGQPQPGGTPQQIG